MEQTNRTILFEELNPEKDNLLTFSYGEEKEGLSDALLERIHTALAVSSFEECLKKLEPVLYLVLDTERNRVRCTKTMEEGRRILADGYTELVPVRLDENSPLLRYLTGMISSGGQSYVLPEEERRFAEWVLSFSEEEQERFEKKYAQILRLFVGSEEEAFKEEMQKFLRRYDQGYILVYMLSVLAQREQEGPEYEETSLPVFVKAREDGQTEIVGISEEFLRTRSRLYEQEAVLYETWIERQLEQTPVKNRRLFTQLFTVPLCSVRRQREELAEWCETCRSYERRIWDAFWDGCRPLLEKLLGIYVYFAQYAVKKPLMRPTLLLANLRPGAVLTEKDQRKLRLYFNSVNEKLYSGERIWYAILPGLEYKKKRAGEEPRQRFSGSGMKRAEEANTAEHITALQDLLSAYQIQTFVSPSAGKETLAGWVAEHGIFDWLEFEAAMPEQKKPEYSYPCFPNFVLCREPLLCVEASYAAAGIYAALQCPAFLEERFGGPVNKELPGAAFELLLENRNLRVPAVLKSDRFSFPGETVEELKSRCAGIVFAPVQGRTIIVNDCASSRRHGVYDTVSRVQTASYMEQKIRSETQDFKAEEIRRFFEGRPGSVNAAWRGSGAEFLNSVIKQTESITYEINENETECVFCFHSADGTYRWKKSLTERER